MASNALCAFSLEAARLFDTLTVSWESVGLGWQVIPPAHLYSDTLIQRLQATYVRFVKAASLAAGLSLTATEMAYLAASPDYQVSGQGWLNALAVWGNPDDITKLPLREVLIAILDFARMKSEFSPKDERLLQALQSLGAPSTDGGLALCAVTGWNLVSLNDLVAQFGPLFSRAGLPALTNPENLQRVYDANTVLKASGVSALALIAATTNEPGVSTTDRLDNVGPGLRTFTPDSTANITVGSSLVLGAGAAKEQVIVTAVTASTFSAVITQSHDGTSTPFPIVGTIDVLGAFQAAIRARYAAADWIAVIKPINNALRELQRDALVAYVLQILSQAGQPVSVDNGTPVNTPDTLFEYLLMDVQMGACMETSRIRLALSSVQLFIERAFLGLELDSNNPGSSVDPGLLQTDEWVWKKRYRLWQANREVFFWPENWQFPELRDDQSPIFKDVIGKLLQKDITEDAATSAYLDYLADLQKIAKLEPCGVGYDAPNVHVVSRSMDGGQTYYYRRYDGASWSPWEETGLKIEGNPVLPTVWNGRLLLFWLQLVKQGANTSPTPPTDPPAAPGDLKDMMVTDAHLSDLVKVATYTKTGIVDVLFNLCWSEYYNGKWQTAHTSNAPCAFNSFSQIGVSFDRTLIQLYAYPESSSNQNRLWLVAESNQGASVFLLHNTESQPVVGDLTLTPPLLLFPLPYDRTVTAEWFAFRGAYSLSCTYVNFSSLANPQFTTFPFFATEKLISTTVVTPPHPVVDPSSSVNEDWLSPFLYADTNNIFYATTDLGWPLIHSVETYGVAAQTRVASPSIPTLVLKSDALSAKPVSVYNPVTVLKNVGSADQAAMTRFISEDAYVARALGTAGAVRYGRLTIGPSGEITD